MKIRNFVLACTLVVAFGATAQNGRIGLNSGSEVRSFGTNSDGFSAVFSFSEIGSQKMETPQGEFSLLNIEGCIPSGHDGTPTIPMFHKMIAAPCGAELSVKVVSYTQNEYQLGDYGIGKLMPCQPSLRKDQNPDGVPFAYDEKAYMESRYGYRPIAEVSSQGVMRGIQIGSLSVNPVRYNPAKGTIMVFNDIVVEVSFKNYDKEEALGLYNATSNPYFDNVYGTLFNSHRDMYTEHPDPWTTPVNMIVVANRMFESTLAPWFEWKTQKGFYLDINYTDVIGTTYNQIKTFLQNKYNTGVANGNAPTFVVIVGDNAQVPASTPNATESGKLSDLYYGSVDGDIYPDMLYSRMSAETTAQLSNIINKTLMYEKYTMPAPDYLNNALLIAGWDSYWNSVVAQPTINYATTYYYNTANGFNNVATYLTQGQYTGCYNNLNTGVGFAYYTAHGGDFEWSDPNLTTSTVNSLTNTGKYFWAIGNCCLSGNFGNTSGACFGEAMIRANNAAFAYIGSVPVTYWYDDYYFGVGATNVFSATPTNTNTSVGAFDGLGMTSAYNTVSSLMFLGNISVCYADAGSYSTHSSPTYYWQSYHTFGDGSIMPYFTEPDENAVSHLPVITVGAAAFSVSASAGSYVALSKDGTLLGTAVVDSSGTVLVDVEMLSTPGDVDIVVTCPQKQPYIETIQAIVPNGPFVTATAHTPSAIHIGSATSVDVSFQNIGTIACPASNVTISCTNPNVTLTSNATGISAVGVGDTLPVNNMFSLHCNTSMANDESFIVSISVQNDTIVYLSNLHFTAVKAVAEFVDYAWQGSYEAGDTVNVTATFRNKGSWPMTNAVATFSTPSNLVSCVQPTVNVGTIGIDSTVSVQFVLVIDESATGNELIQMNFDIASDDNVHATGQGLLFNSCYITIALHDTYGDGWNGNTLELSFSYGLETQYVTMDSGHNYTQTIAVPNGSLMSVDFNETDWASECSFTITYTTTGNVIYTSGVGLSGGFITSFTIDCSAQTTEYAITVDPNIEGGDVSVSQATALAGETIYILSNCWDEYEFVSYMVYKSDDPTVTVPVTDNHFEMPNHDVVVSAEFNYDSVDEEGEVESAVYPNPSYGKFSVEAANMRHVAVTDLIGVSVFEADTEGDHMEMDLSGLPAGFYVVRISTVAGAASQRICIIK